MAKGGGTTRSVNSGNAASSRSNNNTIKRWSIGTDSYGNTTISRKGADAERIYSALNSSVEQAVESKVGSIRSGGGISGITSDNPTYSIIFRDGTTETQIREYIEAMDKGSKLYRAYQEDRLGKARDDFENWYNRMRGR